MAAAFIAYDLTGAVWGQGDSPDTAQADALRWITDYALRTGGGFNPCRSLHTVAAGPDVIEAMDYAYLTARDWTIAATPAGPVAQLRAPDRLTRG